MEMEYLTALAVFALVNWALWYALDERMLYIRAFDYKPFNCRKCLTFWLLAATSAGALMAGFVTFSLTLFCVAVLNAVAMHVDENARYGDDN